MGISEETLLISLVILISQFKSSNAQDQCFKTEEMTVPHLGLSESQIWNAKAQDFEQCAKLCVRRKPCLSITYDTQSGMCELNAGTRADTPTKRGGTLVYSEFQWWPSSLDSNCYSRPCQDSEVCIPGSLANGSPDCSYSCITAVRDVCPLPPMGVSNGRTVGSVNVYTCGKGTVGGGSATCLPNKQWDKEITTCTPILAHSCSDESLCSLIEGYCSEKERCECGNYMTYDENIKECVLDCGDPPEVQNAAVSDNTYHCNPDYFPTTGSEDTITCTESGWTPAGKFACFSIQAETRLYDKPRVVTYVTDTCKADSIYSKEAIEVKSFRHTCGEPAGVAGATLVGDGQERDYICGEDMYPLPGTGNGTIICDEATKTWGSQGFLCGGLRLVQGHLGETMILPHSGYLEMFADGAWRALTQENWTWQATMVACRNLFDLEFGGTFHKDWFGRINPNRLSIVSKMEKRGCIGDEEALEICPHFQLMDGNGDNEIALTCFDSNLTGPLDVLLDDSSMLKGTMYVTVFTVHGGVCGTGWNDRETTVACRTIDPSWTRNHECTNNCFESQLVDIATNHIHCSGDEPHLFYCQNKGWGYHADCTPSNFVGINCNGG